MPLKASALKIGDTYVERVIDNLSRTQMVQYAGAAGDFSPIHHDEIFTVEVAKFPRVMAHGMLGMGAAGKMLANYAGAGRLTKFGVRFVDQIWPGDTLDAKATVTAIREEGGLKLADLAVVVVNQDGKDVVSGNATVLIDA